MPPAKKAAKKAAKSFEEKSGKELRRAYEHTSRVEILQRLLPPGTADAIATLVAYACRELDGKKNREAADLLRASEHLSFAALALPGQANAPLSPELKVALEEQFEELCRKADERWEEKDNHPTMLAEIYRSAREAATTAYEEGAWHRALEFARTAEALAHMNGQEPLTLVSGGVKRKPRRLARGGRLKLVAGR